MMFIIIIIIIIVVFIIIIIIIIIKENITIQQSYCLKTFLQDRTKLKKIIVSKNIIKSEDL